MRTLFSSSHRGSCFIAILLFSSSVLMDNAKAEEGFSATLSMDIEAGYLIVDESSFKVTVSDDFEPRSANWELYDSTSSRHYVSVSDFTQGITYGPLTEWIFDIEIVPETIGPCSCILTVIVIDSDGISYSESTSLFIESTGIAEHQLTPTLLISRNTIDYWHSETYRIQALSSTKDGGAPIFSTLIHNSTNIKCTYGNLEELDDLYAINFNDTTDPRFSDVSWDGDSLTFQLDLKNFDDGWYDVIVFAQSDIQDSHYSHDCISIRVDNTPPNATMDVPDKLNEGYGSVYLDASSTYDEYWGIQGLTYTWTIIQVGSSDEEIAQVISGQDIRTIEFNHEHSGLFSVTLSVSDNAGNIGLTSRTIEIVNMPPVARLTIDGEDYFDNDQITLSSESSILLNASSSTDTANDIDALRYIWRVDNVPMYEGALKSLSWPEGVSDNSFVLSIEVIDADSDSSMISIIVLDDSGSETLPLSILILIISGGFLSYSVFRRSGSDESEIPKWN